MGVIRKKTATRGGEGGVKYVCDVCSADITSTVGTPPPGGICARRHEREADVSLGPHSVRQFGLQRIRPLRAVFRRWRVLPQSPAGHASLPSHRAELRAHLRQELGSGRRTATAGRS